MKIPHNLPQFKDEEAFIIVAGRQDAAFYKASKGILERIDIFKIPTPHYSDHEGEFKSRAKGMVGSTGARRELRDKKIIMDFLKEFKRRIKKVPDFSAVYLFAPDQTKNRIKSILPNDWQKKIRRIVQGNYFYQHPFYLLEKLLNFEIAPPPELVPEPVQVRY